MHFSELWVWREWPAFEGFGWLKLVDGASYSWKVRWEVYSERHCTIVLPIISHAMTIAHSQLAAKLPILLAQTHRKT